MSDTVIKVENLSKQYRLGVIGTGSLAHDVNRWWHRIRGNEDPYLKIGDVNDRTTKGDSQYVWALKDINFEVRRGEVLGIIGRNGAGKSTLLKILSKTTMPTKGRVYMKGRVASLLEVGTGFHPELSGRDNIFLNGAILGMTKQEIKKKFEEIIDFSGVERYIDTPVKRYSSGMYVRLAFAVAAFLEPEILIVDEVLAVGDAEFQKKCLGKMKDVSVNYGRTVLFVSHNMAAVNELTQNCMLIHNGLFVMKDETEIVLNEYVKLTNFDNNDLELDTSGIKREADCDFSVRINSMSFKKTNIFHYSTDLDFEVKFEILKKIESVRYSITIFDYFGNPVGSSFSRDYLSEEVSRNGRAIITLRDHKLAPGNYYIAIAVGTGNQYTGYRNYDVLPRTLHFEIIPQNNKSEKTNASVWHNSWGRIQFGELSVNQ
jgi:lipopolysaccharide transport system ATP-binding protein